MPRLAFFGVGALLILAPALTTAQQQQLAPLPSALPRTHTPRPTTAAITAADLMTRLYIFADDSMQGREHGSRGNAKGTAYLAAEARRMGLQPAGDSGTYFQNIPDPDCYPVLLDASMRLGNTPLVLTQDFLPIGTHSLHNRALAVIYGGRTDAPMALTPAQIAGKLVVFTTPGAPSDSLPPLPPAAGAAAVAVVALDSIAPTTRARMLNKNKPVLHQDPDHPLILLSSAAAKRLFGKELDGLRPGIAGKPVGVAYTFAFSTRNVVAILPGSDPVLRHEYVAVGAHNDHIGWRLAARVDHDSLRVFNHFARIGGEDTRVGTVTPAEMDSITAELATLRRINPPRRDSIYNGADDDGSGSVSLLEIAEQLAAMPVKPKRSILFVWHGSEEDGEPGGSTWFTAHPTVPRDSIVVQLNIDMIGRGNANDIPGGGPNYLQMIGSRKRSTELGDLVERVNTDGQHHLALDTIRGEQYYTRSDQYEYAKYGIPIAFFFTGVHPDYHQVTDEPEYIDYPKMARIASLVSDVAVHVANLDHRLVSDHPNPK